MGLSILPQKGIGDMTADELLEQLRRLAEGNVEQVDPAVRNQWMEELDRIPNTQYVPPDFDPNGVSTRTLDELRSAPGPEAVPENKGLSEWDFQDPKKTMKGLWDLAVEKKNAYIPDNIARRDMVAEDLAMSMPVEVDAANMELGLDSSLRPQARPTSNPTRDARDFELPSSGINDAGSGTTSVEVDGGLFTNVFGKDGKGLSGLAENWKALPEEERQNLSMALISLGSTMMTTPGNFGTGLGAGFGAGLDTYAALDQDDFERGIAEREQAVREAALATAQTSATLRNERERIALERLKNGDTSLEDLYGESTAQAMRLAEKFLAAEEAKLGVPLSTLDEETYNTLWQNALEKARSIISAGKGRADTGLGLPYGL